MLRLALEHQDIVNRIEAELGREFFQNPDYQVIFSAILELGAQVSAARLFDKLKEPQQKVLSELLVQEIPGENLDQIFNDLVSTIKRASGKARLEELLMQLAVAEKAGNTERVLRLRQEINFNIMKSEGPERGVAT